MNGSNTTSNGNESRVTVKFTVVLLIIAGLVGGFFTWIVNHESRITKTEVCVDNLTKSTDRLTIAVEKMDRTLDIVQRDQVRYYKSRDPSFKSVTERNHRRDENGR